ncbi:MAG TPA: hypothetical protein VGA67_04750 [Candidatus Dojkabacteria bacterium]|jgi:hypothetical protein
MPEFRTELDLDEFFTSELYKYVGKYYMPDLKFLTDNACYWFASSIASEIHQIYSNYGISVGILKIDSSPDLPFTVPGVNTIGVDNDPLSEFNWSSHYIPFISYGGKNFSFDLSNLQLTGGLVLLQGKGEKFLKKVLKKYGGIVPTSVSFEGIPSDEIPIFSNDGVVFLKDKSQNQLYDLLSTQFGEKGPYSQL